MMNSLLDLSGKIDPLSQRLFETVNEVAASLGLGFFVVGAAARDMILELGYHQRSKRASLDRDFGIRIASWDEFNRLKDTLLGTGLFKQTTQVQRLMFQGAIEVDIVPFGGIGEDREEIRWPPDEDVVMSTVGFDDAFKAALKVRVKAMPPLDILVASIPGMALLKLISWADHPHSRPKDALDLAFILEHYLDAGNNERFYKENLDLVEVVDFDYVRAGARLLGRDVAKMAKPETLERIGKILADATAEEGNPSLLVRHMIQKDSGFDDSVGNRYTELFSLLRAFAKGVEDRQFFGI
jgi:predicted nucleotidyltransferase